MAGAAGRRAGAKQQPECLLALYFLRTGRFLDTGTRLHAVDGRRRRRVPQLDEDQLYQPSVVQSARTEDLSVQRRDRRQQHLLENRRSENQPQLLQRPGHRAGHAAGPGRRARRQRHAAEQRGIPGADGRHRSAVAGQRQVRCIQLCGRRYGHAGEAGTGRSGDQASRPRSRHGLLSRPDDPQFLDDGHLADDLHAVQQCGRPVERDDLA